MNPHEITVDVLLEQASLASMPGKIHKIALLRRVLLDISSFAFTKPLRSADAGNSKISYVHFSPPIPSIGEISDQGARLAAIIDSSAVHSSESTGLHLLESERVS